MKRKVYKVRINGRQFLRTISRDLAERTAKSAESAYGLKAEIVEAFEEYNNELAETI